LPDVHYCRSAGADAMVIATEWEQFRALDFSRLKRIMTQPVIVDLRNIYRADEMRRAAFQYFAIGRGEWSSLKLDIVPETEPRSISEQRAGGRVFRKGRP
jgi:UDP-glucose/GDP-mannose dehydrogenase family, UDP binding domain